MPAPRQPPFAQAHACAPAFACAPAPAFACTHAPARPRRCRAAPRWAGLPGVLLTALLATPLTASAAAPGAGCTPGAAPLTELTSWGGARLGAAPFASPLSARRLAAPPGMPTPMPPMPPMPSLSAPRTGAAAIAELARSAAAAGRLPELPRQAAGRPADADPAGATSLAYLPWLAPVAVAARSQLLYVADAGRQTIYRYDLAQQNMSPFAPFPVPAAGTVPAMAVAPDLSLYVSDGAGRRVLHYGVDGRLLRTFADELGLARPSGLALAADGSVLVADNLYRHVLRFDSLGHLRELIEPDQARSIDGLAAGASGLYLLDRLGRQVLALAPDGQLRAVIGAGALALAGPLALDGYQRLYVGDRADNTVKVYQDDQLLDAGPAAPRFGRIDGLALEGDTLYVADSARARVVLLRVARPCAGDQRAP